MLGLSVVWNQLVRLVEGATTTCGPVCDWRQDCQGAWNFGYQVVSHIAGGTNFSSSGKGIRIDDAHI